MNLSFNIGDGKRPGRSGGHAAEKTEQLCCDGEIAAKPTSSTKKQQRSGRQQSNM